MRHTLAFWTAVPTMGMDSMPQHSKDAVVSDVWLLARILEVPLLSRLSQGSYPLCHWGVLITSLPATQVSVNLNSKGRSENDVELGTLYQISRSKDNQNMLRVSGPFLLSELRTEWIRPSWSRVGRTTMTHDQISSLGLVANVIDF